MPDDEKLDPMVSEFKGFIKSHPKLITQVRNGEKTWNDVYQDWILTGDDNNYWDQFINTNETNSLGSSSTESSSTTEVVDDNNPSSNNLTVAQLFKSLGNMNVNDLQNNLNQFNGVMNNFQQLLGQFQGGQGPVRGGQSDNPFSFRGF